MSSRRRIVWMLLGYYVQLKCNVMAQFVMKNVDRKGY